MKLTARLVAAALALVALATPRAVDAGTRSQVRSHHAGPSYPMQPLDFRVLIAKRLEAVRATIDDGLDRGRGDPAGNRAIQRSFDDACGPLRVEFNRVVADGIVTRAEAEKVEVLISRLRDKVRGRPRAEKDPSAKGKAISKKHAAKKGRSLKVATIAPAKPKAEMTKASRARAPRKPGRTKAANAPARKRKLPRPEPGTDL